VRVLATHEQVLGGEGGQVYLGCRFPADPAYARLLAEHAAKIGTALAEKGALGRFSVDFVAAAVAAGAWEVFAIEVNLRKGGTTHPYAALRNLVPGRYDVAAGRWIAEDGSSRAYTSSDNLVHESWLGLEPADVIDWVARAGLQFDPVTKVGTVLHMLAGLAIDGRFGVTAIAPTAAEADAMYEQVRETVQRLADRRATDREPSAAWPEVAGEGA
jgi:pheganomycin biosynthesis PGM1-like protein